MPKHVLVVDDNPHVRRSLRSLLESDGFRVSGEAADGAIAIEQARQLKPDLIVLDFAMPVMNGLQAAPVLRRMMPKVPIILFTLYADSRLREEAVAAGITAVVSKNDAVATLVSKAQMLVPD
jgi:CheY-like chemotaxis protein